MQWKPQGPEVCRHVRLGDQFVSVPPLSHAQPQAVEIAQRLIQQKIDAMHV